MSRTSLAVRALDARPLRTLLRRIGRWEGTLVLTYHRIGDARDSVLHPALFSADAAAFGAQLDVLQHEAEVVAADDALAPTTRGRRVAITFDDGYRDTAEVAWPLLAARGLPATVFLATGYLDRPRLAWWDELAWIVHGAGWSAESLVGLCSRYAAVPAAHAERFLERVATAAGTGRPPLSAADGLWMTWPDARALRDAGAGIGGHTVSHPVLSRVDDERLVAEIEGCRAALRDRLSLPMRLFSYPLGGPRDVDHRAHAPLRAAGVELAFACAGGVARGGRSPVLGVPRASAPQEDDHIGARFRTTLALPTVFARW